VGRKWRGDSGHAGRKRRWTGEVGREQRKENEKKKRRGGLGRGMRLDRFSFLKKPFKPHF
jgi:hypothetical protein